MNYVNILNNSPEVISPYLGLHIIFRMNLQNILLIVILIALILMVQKDQENELQTKMGYRPSISPSESLDPENQLQIKMEEIVQKDLSILLFTKELLTRERILYALK